MFVWFLNVTSSAATKLVSSVACYTINLCADIHHGSYIRRRPLLHLCRYILAVLHFLLAVVNGEVRDQC